MSGGAAARLLTGRKVLLRHIRLLVQAVCVQVYPANQNGIIPNMTSEIIVQTAEELIELGVTLGSLLRGGETIELVGDIGAGKTTLTKGLYWRGQNNADKGVGARHGNSRRGAESDIYTEPRIRCAERASAGAL